MNFRTSLSSLILWIVCVLQFSTATLAQTDSLRGNPINISKAINVSVIAEPLNDKVNSPFIESGPILTKDGKRLYFSRDGHPKNTGGVKDQDIWFTEFNQATQSWTEAINLGPPLNNKGPNFICGVGRTGDTVLLGNVYSKTGKMSAGLSVSSKQGEQWSFPVAVFLSQDYNFSENVSYDLSHDRKSLVIAQEKEDSHGKLDLYVAFKDLSGKHTYSGTESVNLGPVINSFGDETSPFLAYDGKTLFFSSNGHYGYGNFDVFMSRRLDDTWKNWSKPENLGSGINTVFDDSHFGFTPTSRYAYYSRGLSSSNSDIYQIEMTYLFKNVKTLLEDLKDSDAPIEIGQTHVVKNVFDDNLWEIKKGAMRELEAIFNYMERFKTMTVMISTHSNEHKSRNESFTLSNERIAVIRDYLIKRGIEKSRLNYQGYGHDILVNTKDPVIKKDIAASVEFKFVNYGR